MPVHGYFEVFPYRDTLSGTALGFPPQKVLYLAYQPSNHTLYITYKLYNLRLPYTKQHVNSLKFTSNMLRLEFIVANNKQHPISMEQLCCFVYGGLLASCSYDYCNSILLTWIFVET